MTGRRSLGWTYNQAAKTKAAEALERSRREAAATTEMSGHAVEPSNELSRAREGSHKRIRGVGHRDEPAFLKPTPAMTTFSLASLRSKSWSAA